MCRCALSGFTWASMGLSHCCIDFISHSLWIPLCRLGGPGSQRVSDCHGQHEARGCGHHLHARRHTLCHCHGCNPARCGLNTCIVLARPQCTVQTFESPTWLAFPRAALPLFLQPSPDLSMAVTSGANLQLDAAPGHGKESTGWLGVPRAGVFLRRQ